MDDKLHPAARDGVRPPALTMLSPRDEDEGDTVWQLVNVSYPYAYGQWTTKS